MPQARHQLFVGIDLQNGVLLPGEVEYVERQESYWSSTSKLGPGVILRPISAQEVSSIVKTLVEAQEPFAIRSGGHTQWPGANNIKDGVQIDLCCLDWTRLDRNASTADIGPGAHWEDVYFALEQHGFMVAGGRNGKVGVGGLLLGGGQTFFTGTRGFACDDVLQYEVVLGNGQIVTADAETNRDLFHVLKGGTGNFGIVTNFKMRAFKHDKIWGGLRVIPHEYTEAMLEALHEFTTKVAEDPNSNLLLLFAKMPDQPDIHAIAAMINVAAAENAPAYQKYLDMPAVADSSKLTTVRAMVTEYDPAPSGYYNFFYTISVKNDTRIYRRAVELHDQLVADLMSLIPDGSFLTECLFQPLPRMFGQLSRETGGNIMGISSQPDDGVLFVAIVVVKTAEQSKFSYPKLVAWGEAVREYAASIENGLLPWVYMNYADRTQDPLGSYGHENVRKMKEVAAKYDPDEVFQKLSPGGFKITKLV